MDELTLKQAAKRAGCSYTTLLKAVKSGALPAHQKDIPAYNAKWWAVREEDLNVWIEKRRHP